MKRLVIALVASVMPVVVGGCATGYDGYGGGPYAFNGYYDDFYGPVYDGYWGNDGFFYYRGGAGERRFRRGDAAHFRRDGAPGGGFHSFGGSFNRGPGMHTPHFGGGRGGGGFHGGHR